MSYAANGNVEAVKVIDKRVDWVEEAQFAVFKSGTESTYRVLPTQNYSVSNVTWNAQPPSPFIAINREVFAQFTFELTITASTPGANGFAIAPGLYDAPRFMPLNQCIQTLSCTINDSMVSMNNYQAVNAFLRANTSDSNLHIDYSMAPSCPDFYQNYTDAGFPGSSLNAENGGGVDPLRGVGVCYGANGAQGRGGFPMEIVSNSSTEAVVRFTTTEPLILSPFLSAGDCDNAFIGVQTLVIQMVLGNLSRLWSHSTDTNASVISGITVELVGAPNLLLNFITPSKIVPIPKSIAYNFNNVNVYPTDMTGVIAGGGNFTVNSQNIQLDNIPRRIYLFLRRRDADATFATTDTFARINSISMNFDNRSGLFAGANSQQLYAISKNSGLNYSWTEWNKYCGSVLIIDVCKSLMLNSEAEAPSLASTKQISVTVNATNISGANVGYTMYMLVISDGLMTLSNGTSVLQKSILSPDDIVNASDEKNHIWQKSTNFFGNGFYNKLKRAAKGINRFAKESGVVSKLLDASGASQYGDVARSVGYGLVNQGTYQGGASSGGLMSGGRKVSKKQLTYM